MRVESTNKSKEFRNKIKEISTATEELKDNKMQLNNSRLVSTSMSRDNNRLRLQLFTMKVEAEKNRHQKTRNTGCNPSGGRR